MNRDEVDEITANAERARVTVIKDMCSTNTLWVERDYLSQVGQVTRVILLAMPIGLFIAMFAAFVLSAYIVLAIAPEGCGAHGIKDPFLAYDTMSAADFARFCPDEAWTIWTIGASAIVGLIGGFGTVIYWVVQREAKILHLRSASHGEVLDEYRAWKAARAAGG